MRVAALPPAIGDTAIFRGTWCGRAVDCSFQYEKHPAAGSKAYPGAAVFAHGKIGPLCVTHNVSENGDEFYVWIEGPQVLDPLEGCAFGVGAGGSSLQDALDGVFERFASVETWIRRIKNLKEETE